MQVVMSIYKSPKFTMMTNRVGKETVRLVRAESSDILEMDPLLYLLILLLLFIAFI